MKNIEQNIIYNKFFSRINLHSQPFIIFTFDQKELEDIDHFIVFDKNNYNYYKICKTIKDLPQNENYLKVFENEDSSVKLHIHYANKYHIGIILKQDAKKSVRSYRILFYNSKF